MSWALVILFDGDAPGLLPICRSLLSCEGNFDSLIPIFRSILSCEDNFESLLPIYWSLLSGEGDFESSVFALFEIPVIVFPKVFLLSSFVGKLEVVATSESLGSS